MKLTNKTQAPRAVKTRPAGFTLVEVLVALAFMALIIPVVSRGLKLAALAGEVSQRKAVAMRIADKVLGETIVTGQWNGSSSGGNETAGVVQYHWTVRNEPWAELSRAVAIGTENGLNQTGVSQNNLHQISVDVSYPAQGQTYYVRLSTVVDVSRQVTANTPPAQ